MRDGRIIARGLPKQFYRGTRGQGLLDRPVAGNLVAQPLDPSNVAWTRTGLSGVSIVPGMVGPDGKAVYMLSEDGTTGDHRIFQVITVVAGQTYDADCYFKTAGRVQAGIAETTFGNAFYDTIRGRQLSGPGRIEWAGDDWWKCSLIGYVPAGSSYVLQLRIGVAGSTSYTGTAGLGILVSNPRVRQR